MRKYVILFSRIVFLFLLNKCINYNKYMKTPEITGKKIIQAGKFLSLNQLELSHPSGKKTPYEVVERNANTVF